MNARPPFEPVHDPLDAEEAAIARAYRSLPGGEPSPELDARILSQARAAVMASRRRPRPWFLGAGFGAAAAAVMAAGIAWQLGWLGGIPGTAVSPSSTQRTNSPPKRAAPAPVAEETIDIDYVKEERKAKADDAPAPAAAAIPADQRRQDAAKAPPAPAAPPAPTPPPPPPQEPMRDEAPPEPEPSVLNAPAPQPFPAQEAPAAVSGLGATRARAASEREGMAESDAAAGPAGGRLSAKQIAGLPSWTEDEHLAPDAWLERIRERVNRGDRQSAEYSLRRFVQVHPQREVPRELRRLLVE